MKCTLYEFNVTIIHNSLRKNNTQNWYQYIPTALWEQMYIFTENHVLISNIFEDESLQAIMAISILMVMLILEW